MASRCSGIEAIRSALHQHLVIFFRDQELTTGQHRAFAERLGPLEPHPYVQGLPGGRNDI